ncbi:hypothetical protein KQX64_17715 [Rhodopseudomonas palustris]|nr:hypothetical protein KQX64_17715 [Rhodopseudomonas palustris]
MQIWNYDPATGELVSSGLADESPMEPGAFLIPAFATTIAPPSFVDGFCPVFRDGGWTLVEDHRGETWWDPNGVEVVISELGKVPEGLSNVAPPPPEPPPPPPDIVTPRQLRLALTQLGLRQAVEDYVGTQDISVKDSWQYATQFERTHPLILAAATALGKTDNDLDALFSLAKTL